MADSVTIGTIDTSTTGNGYVTVPVTMSINSTGYTPDPFIVNATDVPSVVASVTQQAESYKQGVLSAIAANGAAAAESSLSALDGTVIDL